MPRGIVASVRTPGHAVVNLCALGPLGAPAPAIVLGAVLPDLPILVLWAFERLRGRGDEEIWREVYPTTPWIQLIHGAHSIPLALLGLGAAAALGSLPGMGFFASVLLHSLLDVPFHVHDAHRHFLPFSSWRFVSPLSYWDVRHHGRVVGCAEAVVVTLACAWLWPGAGPGGRVVLLLICVYYARSCWQMYAAAPRPVS